MGVIRYFYACWDYRFLALLLVTTLVDYGVALAIHRSFSALHRRVYLALSIGVNLSVLCFFKYWNFFVSSLADLISLTGHAVPTLTLDILVPVGVSFYIFKSMSYVIDVYRGTWVPTRNILDYALFVSFFPQLLAGPIERSSQLLRQIAQPRSMTSRKIRDGGYYFCWGLFLKVFVADNLARIVDPVFAATTPQGGFVYLVAGYAYAFQIYGDFAGYSYMAKGLGGVLGFDMMHNFHLPYFARDPQDFWRRWHISLSTWFRDYLYIPLGGSRGSLAMTVRNLLLTMLLCGLWHGAQMTFVVWGTIHGLLLAGQHLLRKVREGGEARRPNALLHGAQTLLFFHVIVLSWYFFRAESLAQVGAIFRSLVFDFAFDPQAQAAMMREMLFYAAPLVAVETLQFLNREEFPLRRFSVAARAAIYVVLFYLLVIFGATDAQNFIYMQF